MTMQNIDDAVIDGLRPQTRRYDVPVGDELVIAVLPNGSKTWTWVHTGGGRPRRQTLGVYPEMSLAGARKALVAAAAARSRQADSGEPEYVIRDGRIEAASAQLRWPIAAFVVALATIAAGLGWFWLDSEAPPKAAPVSAIGATESMQLDTSLGASGLNATRAAAGADSGTAALPTASQADHLAPVDTPSTLADATAQVDDAGSTPTVVSADVDTAFDANRDEIDAFSDAIETAADLDEHLADAQPRPGITEFGSAATVVAADRKDNSNDTIGAVADTIETASGKDDAIDAALVPPPDAAVAPGDPAVSADPATGIRRASAAAADTGPEPVSSAETRPAAAATASPQPDAVIGTRVEAHADLAALVDDPRVARAAITTAVVDREPVDALGPVIVGNGEDMQNYFFFTELRQLAGQRIRHRWIAGDRIMAEVPFDVGDAWRWRVYSSKRLQRSLAGPWRVQVVLDDGTVIYSFPFRFQP